MTDQDALALLEWGLKGFEGWTNIVERMARDNDLGTERMTRLKAVLDRLGLVVEDQRGRFK